MGYDLDRIESLIGAPDKGKLAAEALAFMGGRLAVNGIAVPLPTAGACSLLEIVGSPYVVGGAPGIDAARVAFFVCSLGAAAVGPVQCAVLGGAPEIGLAGPAREYCAALAITPAIAEAIADIYAKAFAGAIVPFNFFPKSGGADMPPLVFGAEWLAAMQRLGADCGMDRDETLWGVPLIALGFLAVAQARFNGAKNVDRGNALDWSRVTKAVADE